MKASRKHNWVAACLCVCIIMLFTVAHAFGDDTDQNLLTKARQTFGTLPRVMESAENPVTPEKARLGKALFFESRISVDGTVSCAKCHPFSLHAADGLKKAVGNHCKENPRNAPTIFNAASQISAHWIGNRTGVEDQAKQAVIGPPAFGMAKYEDVENRLRKYKGYVKMFREAFPEDKEPVTIDNFAKAIGAYERTLVTPSSFDAYLSGANMALTAKQKSGLKLFMDMGCAACHSGTYIGGQMYRKFGIVDSYWKYTKSDKIDEGRFAVTKSEADKYVFKVPILRNVSKTPPYFHDGSVESLESAIVIMGKVQLGKEITEAQASGMSEFLGSLTGELTQEMLAVPVLPALD